MTATIILRSRIIRYLYDGTAIPTINKMVTVSNGQEMEWRTDLQYSRDYTAKKGCVTATWQTQISYTLTAVRLYSGDFMLFETELPTPRTINEGDVVTVGWCFTVGVSGTPPNPYLSISMTGLLNRIISDLTNDTAQKWLPPNYFLWADWDNTYTRVIGHSDISKFIDYENVKVSFYSGVGIATVSRRLLFIAMGYSSRTFEGIMRTSYNLCYHVGTSAYYFDSSTSLQTWAVHMCIDGGNINVTAGRTLKAIFHIKA